MALWPLSELISSINGKRALRTELTGSIVEQPGITLVRLPIPQNSFIIPEIISNGTNIFLSSVGKDGALYATRFKEILKSIDDGQTWTTIWVVPTEEPRFPSQIFPLDNGAVLVVLGGNRDTGEPDGCIYLSDVNQQNFTKVLATPQGCIGVSYGFSIHGPFVLLSEYGAKNPAYDSPRRVYLSKDYGATFSQIFELENNVNVHTHNVSLDIFSGRIWVTVGDQQPEQNVYYTDNWGETWTTLWPPGECPINPLSIACLPDCVLIGSDNFNLLSFWRYDKRTERVERIWKLDTPGRLQVSLSSMVMPIGTGGYIALIPTHSDPPRTDNSMLIATDGVMFYTLWRQQNKTDDKERIVRLAGVHNNTLYLQSASNVRLKFTLPTWS